MYLLVDSHRMCIVYIHDTPKILRDLSHIELSHCPTSIFEANATNLDFYSLAELKLLYRHLVDEDYDGYGKEMLILVLLKLCETVAHADVSGFELSLQATKIKSNDKKYYRYVRGSNIPQELEDIFENHARAGSVTSVKTDAPVAMVRHVVPEKPWVKDVQMVIKYPPPWA